MAKVNISTKSGSVVSGDWSPALDAAFADLVTEGGQMFFDQQEVLLKSQATLGVFGSPPSSIPLWMAGDGSSRIRIDAGSTVQAMRVNNTRGFKMSDMIVRGTGSTDNYVDCKEALYLAGCGNAVISDTHFLGVQAAQSVITSQAGCDRLMLKNVRMDGCAVPVSESIPTGLIRSVTGGSVVLDGVTCWDIQNLKGETISKTSASQMAYCVYLAGGTTPPATGALLHSVADIRNSTFDEGNFTAIYIQDYHAVNIENVAVNTSAMNTGRGIHLKNCERVTLKYVWTGYGAQNLPLVKLENCPRVIVIGQERSESATPYRIEADTTSSNGLRMIHCNDTIEVQVV